MNYQLLTDLIQLVKEFDNSGATTTHPANIDGFKRWVYLHQPIDQRNTEPEWVGKESGRSAESVISTMLVHLNRYAKSYSKAAIQHSDFSTQEDFIYLINLQTFGPMSKMSLIKHNVHDKTSGMQVINRLVKNKWITQADSDQDKRSKVISITELGIETLNKQMDNIRLATKIVAGDLTHPEKMELIRLLTKLDNFHQEIFHRQLRTQELLKVVQEKYNLANN